MTPCPYGFSVFTGSILYFCKVDIAKSTTKPLLPPFFSVNLYKEYTSLKSRELEELPRFVVMIWQPFMLLRSASLCLFRITLCMQRYDFVSCKTKVS